MLCQGLSVPVIFPGSHLFMVKLSEIYTADPTWYGARCPVCYNPSYWSRGYSLFTNLQVLVSLNSLNPLKSSKILSNRVKSSKTTPKKSPDFPMFPLARGASPGRCVPSHPPPGASWRRCGARWTARRCARWRRRSGRIWAWPCSASEHGLTSHQWFLLGKIPFSWELYTFFL